MELCHSFLIIQSDLGDYQDNGLSLSLISQHDLFIAFLLEICNHLTIPNKYKHGLCAGPF